MSKILDDVNQRTRLAGQNRVELLLFRLGGAQVYGINVFKVQEVILAPALTHMPKSSLLVEGVVHMRGKTIPVIDMARAIRRPAPAQDGPRFVIVTEFNRRVQGFLVAAVDRIVNLQWSDMQPPPKGIHSSYLTAVTKVDGGLVEVIDVEKILAEISPADERIEVSAGVQADGSLPRRILVADDSLVARNQVKRTLEKLGIESVLAENGREALRALRAMAAEGPLGERLAMVISDIEMPGMDGYTLTTEIRNDPELKDLYVMLHTSLSGVFNQSLVERVGANRFVAKFDATELANAVLEHLNAKR